MPTYEYRCDSCAKNFDVVQSFTDDPLTECPTCGSPVRKVFGSVGIVFKGSGFYKTDSRSGGSATVTSESSSATSDSGGSDSGGSDSGGSDSGGSDSSSSNSSDKSAHSRTSRPSRPRPRLRRRPLRPPVGTRASST